MRLFRVITSTILILLGVIFTFLPGSTIFLLAGLGLLSVDFYPARRFLTKAQRAISSSARRVDLFLLNRKYK
jgi:hypothetical protein